MKNITNIIVKESLNSKGNKMANMKIKKVPKLNSIYGPHI